MAMFFAVELEKAKLERVVTWILVIYVVVHVVSHVVLRSAQEIIERIGKTKYLYQGMYQLLFDNLIILSLTHVLFPALTFAGQRSPLLLMFTHYQVFERAGVRV